MINRKISILSDRYRGIGRPREKDYDYKTVMELTKELDLIYNQHIDRLSGFSPLLLGKSEGVKTATEVRFLESK